MDYIIPKEAAEKWTISKRRVQKLCEEGRIAGVIRFGRSWAIPKDAKRLKGGHRKIKQITLIA